MKARSMTVHDIINATGGVLIGNKDDRVFYNISTDSRTITPGSLFVPLVGECFDGHDFIGNAIAGGASGIIVQRGRKIRESAVDVRIAFFVVEDTLQALGDIAHFWRRQLDIPVIGVTGSSGKTTTKEMIAGIMSSSKHVLKNPGNFNNLVGLPLTLLTLKEDHDIAVLEMGTNRTGEIRRLTEIAEPVIGVITNIGPAHLENFKTLTGVREEKGALFSNMRNDGAAVINIDDQEINVLADRWLGRKVTFSMFHEADVQAKRINAGQKEGIAVSLVIDGYQREIIIPVIGAHNIYNVLAAAAVSWAAGIGFDQICEGLAAFRQVQGRMKVHALANGVYLIDDTYNSNPASLREAFKAVNELAEEYHSIVVLGDMLELGDEAIAMHEDAGSFMAESGVHQAFLVGNMRKYVAKGARQSGMEDNKLVFFDSTDDLMKSLHLFLKNGDWILVKGSRGMKMDRFVQAILQEYGEVNNGEKKLQ